MKAGWLDAPLTFRDLAEAICMLLTIGGSPFCFHGGFWPSGSCSNYTNTGLISPNEATHTLNSSLLASQPLPAFHTATTKSYYPIIIFFPKKRYIAIPIVLRPRPPPPPRLPPPSLPSGIKARKHMKLSLSN